MTIQGNVPYNGAVQGYVHSVETGGMVDGPGIRYVLFFSGCNLRCKYCHNPDTWKLRDGKLTCVADVIHDIRKYQSYLHFSGGGVTITGGEPLMQSQFLIELLKACKNEKLHTALDTAGYVSPEIAAQVLQHTDLLLLDLKAFNPTVYKELTGVELAPTLELLRLSQDMGVPIWIRFVLVPGLTDNEDDLRAMADFLHQFPHIEKIEVLPFHKLGEFKWAELGLPYTLADVEPPSEAALAQARELLVLDV